MSNEVTINNLIRSNILLVATDKKILQARAKKLGITFATLVRQIMADAAGSKKKGGTPPSASEVPAASVAEEPAATDATAETPAPRRTPTGTFNVASLAQRLRPAQPTDLPEAPILGATPGSAGPVNLGSLASPALTSAVPRPSAPPERATRGQDYD